MADNIAIKFTTIGGQQAIAESASIANAMNNINIAQMKLVKSQVTASGTTRQYQTTQKRLVTSTQKGAQAQEKYTKVTKDTTLAQKGLFGQTQSVLSAIGKVATWTMATTAVFGLFRALTGLVKTLMEFDNAMARVSTVTRGGEQALLRVREAVKQYGATTSAALTDVAKAAYYLGSAGLTASEQVAGLEHVMDLTVGTMGDVNEIARLVAGAYNVFGQNMEGAIGVSEKMQQISDVLAYTYSCYTPDTEVLTDKGWKLFTELDKTEKIATLNPKTKKLEYQKPHEYVNKPFEGKLCHLKGQFADIKITPTHKLYTQIGHNPVKKEYVLVEAKDVFGRAKKFYRGCKWKGKIPKYFILPEVENKTGDGKEKKIPIKIWIRFLAWYLSEGHCVWTNKDGKPIYCITISQSEKSSHYKDLEEVMQLMPFQVSCQKDSKRVGGFHIANKQLCAYLKQFGKAKEKYLPDFIKGLSKNLLRLFIKTYAYGDGTHVKENWAIHIFTASDRMKNDFQEMALKADYGCTTGWRKGSEKFIKNFKTKSSGNWDITLSKRTEFLMNDKRNKYEAIKRNRKTISKEEWIDYKGNVVCVEVPNHVIFVRRNGKSFWCGNTQQVELGEIASAMGLVGSVAGLINMPFEVLVGTLGELNSSLLKGTRAGTSLMNAFLQISKKSDQLTNKLGIVFDPSKPLDFVEIMEKLNRKYGEGALSVMELKELMDVFGLRGGRAVGIILNRYEKWRDTVNKGKEDFEGFAELMAEKFEDTLPRQMEIAGNQFKVSFVDNFESAGNQLKEVVKEFNKLTERQRKETTNAIRWNRLIEKGLSDEEKRRQNILNIIKNTVRQLPRLIGGIPMATGMDEAFIKRKRALEEIGESRTRQFLIDSEISGYILQYEDELIGKSKEQVELKKQILKIVDQVAKSEKDVDKAVEKAIPLLSKILTINELLDLTTENRLKKLIAVWKTEKDILSTTVKVGEALKRASLKESQRYNIQLMRLKGYSEEEISLQKVKNFMDKVNYAAQQDETTRGNVLEMSDLIGKSTQEQLELMTKLGGDPLKNVVGFQKLWNNYLLSGKKLTADIASNLQSAVETGIEKLLTGTSDWREVLQDVGKIMLKAQITEAVKVFQHTGIFESVSEGIIHATSRGSVEMEDGIKSGADYHAEKVGGAMENATDRSLAKVADARAMKPSESGATPTGVGASVLGVISGKSEAWERPINEISKFVDEFTGAKFGDVLAKSTEKGMKNALASVTGAVTTEGGGKAGIASAAMGMGAGLLGGVGGWLSQPTSGYITQEGDYSDLQTRRTYRRGGQPVSTRGGMVTNYAKSAVSGAMVGQGMGGGAGRTTGGMIGGIVGGMMSMSPYTAWLAPIMPMLGSWIGGMFGKKKEPRIEREEKERTNTVTSKIDVSNKQLEWVNRNLVALRAEREPYPMPESFYFAERWGGRGGSGGPTFGNIIIHVGSDSQGSDVASAFADRFIVSGNRILQ